ncbi:MAG: Gfo/Idh/MocA family oxidoreductase [Spirochaetaceae bacterium]|nr:Gfo/Idh/MocA family oxidoreductase [Spirochaetaceae bacterium]
MKKIKIGSVGLGRLGLQHAKNIASLPNAELVALCDVNEECLKKEATALDVPKTFTDFNAMIADKEIDAVCIASPSALHPQQVCAALDAGKHVFCEKPLGITVEDCRLVEKACAAHKDLIFQLGFMRRFDDSYAYAKEKIDAGHIGKPILFRSYSQDPEKFIEGAIAFAPHSGGQFFDMAVHDIDLARWMIGDEPAEVWAIGGCYAHKEFAQYDDGDNVSALMKFKSGAMGFLFAGRTAPHGYNVETEIIGTKGTLRIASVPQKNLVEVLGNGGITRECSENFLERFEKSYLSEMSAFCEAVISGKPAPRGGTAEDGRRVTEIAFACREAFISGQLHKIS